MFYLQVFGLTKGVRLKSKEEFRKFGTTKMARGKRRLLRLLRPLRLLPYFDILWYNIHKKLIYGPPLGDRRWFGASKGVIS